MVSRYCRLRTGQYCLSALQSFDDVVHIRAIQNLSPPYRHHAVFAKVDAQFAVIGENEGRRQPARRSKLRGHISKRQGPLLHFPILAQPSTHTLPRPRAHIWRDEGCLTVEVKEDEGAHFQSANVTNLVRLHVCYPMVVGLEDRL